MKVLLTHGYFIQEDEKEQRIMRPYPPLGLLYISAFLDQHKVTNIIFDSTFQSKEKLFYTIKNEMPDVVAIYANLMTKINVLSIAKKAKEINPKCLIVMGGPDVTYNVAEYLNHGADIIIIGEGENTMLELVQLLEKNIDADLSLIQGVAYYNHKKELIKTAPRIKEKSLDEFPFPNRSAIDISNYLSAWKKHHGMNALNVSTQRGCPYTCKWCSTAVYGQSYRRRSPSNLLAELKLLKESYNPDSIWFVDDVFTVSHKWLQDFVDELRKNDFIIPFECITRADRLDEKVIQLLKMAGCFRVWIGAESGSQKIIDAMDRRVDVNKVRDMIIAAKKYGIETGTFIMLGYPGETMDDINQTINHLKSSNPDHFTITIAYPIKGTGLFQEVESTLLKKPEWTASTDRDLDFTRTFSRRFYEYAVSHVVNEVNYHKNSIQSGPIVKGLKLKSKSMAAKLAMKWVEKFN